MKEAFDLIRKRIEEITVDRSEDGIITGCNMGICEDDDCLKCMKKKILSIVSEVEAEYMKNPMYQYAMVYAKNLVDFGVDVRDKLDSAVAQSMALNQAYIKGVDDERKRIYEAEYGKKGCALCYLGSPCEYQNEDVRIPDELMGWIPCSERLPEEATVYEVTEEIIICSQKQYIVEHRLFGTEGEWLCPSNRKVIAWMPLPEAYRRENE